MSLGAMKYNPAFRAEDELVRSFVVRHTDLELILEVLRDSGGSANQHQLIVGPRGSGKTTLVRRVAAEARRGKELASKWYPVVFGEEAYAVGTPGEFWLEALLHLADQTQQERWSKAYDELLNERDEIRLRERALAQLMDFADQQGKRILLVVENLNMLLGEQLGRDSGWDIRHTLQNEPRILLLGTATSRFEEIENIDCAWFELLTVHELKPLDAAECLTLWQAVSGDESGTAKIRPIQILTGGNPRLLIILAKFAAKRSFRELMEELVQLIDDHTEYFKSHLDNLPALERKVFAVLLDKWDPLTAREAAQGARIDVNKASALLRRLAGRGAVQVIAENGRKKQYQAAERLYNIYYLMRRRGHPASRVRAAVAFMTHFYEEEQLVEAGVGLAEEACGLPPLQRELHYWAYRDLIQHASKPELGSKILEATPRAFFEAPDVPRPVLELYKSYAATAPIDGESTKDAAATEPAGIPVSEKAAREAVKGDPSSFGAWVWLGWLLHEELERYEEAEEAYRKALELEPESAVVWAQLGRLLHEKLERYDEAGEAYRKALELEPESAVVWAQLGRLLHEKLGRYEAAEEAYRKALELEPESAVVWAQLGRLLHEKLDRYEEAEEAYRKVTDLAPEQALPWAKLGELLHEKLERYEEAEEAYHKATELNPKLAGAWAGLGFLLHTELERYDEAEQAYHKATELNPKLAGAWVGLGFLLHEELERYDEAEEAYRKALELQPDVAFGWAHLGQLLHEKLERYEEAEQAYRKATELEPEVALGWAQLGQLLHEKLKRYDEAEEVFRKAYSLRRHPDTVLRLIQLWEERGDEAGSILTRSEKMLREATRESPDDWQVVGALAVFFASQNKWQEALKEATPFLAAVPNSQEARTKATDFLIEAAAAGFAREALELLRNSPALEALEPLEVGLRLYLGQKPRAPREILEVGQDVADRIRKKSEVEVIELEPEQPQL